MNFYSFIVTTKNKPKFSKKTTALSSIINSKTETINNRYIFAEPKTQLALCIIIKENYETNKNYFEIFTKIVNISDSQIFDHINACNIPATNKKSLTDMLCNRRDYLKDLYNAEIIDITSCNKIV
jgi:hypothetical protein